MQTIKLQSNSYACTTDRPFVKACNDSICLANAVPAQILPQLVERQQFRCPYCHSIQNVSLSPEVAHQIISQHQDQQKRHTAVAKQSQQQPDWQNQARPFTQGHHEPATLNRVADTAGGSSLQYHVPGGRVQTGSGDDLNLADARSSGEWGSLGMQQHRHESDIFTYKSSQRETDRQMLADVWQQSMHDDDEGNVANRNGYDSHQGRQGLPAVALPEEDEAEEEHQAGDTFMVGILCKVECLWQDIEAEA